MLFLDVKPKVSHKWFRKTICSVDIIYIIEWDIVKKKQSAYRIKSGTKRRQSNRDCSITHLLIGETKTGIGKKNLS